MYSAPMFVFAAFSFAALILISIVRGIAWILRRSVARTMGGPSSDRQVPKEQGEQSRPEAGAGSWLRTNVASTEQARVRKAEVAGVNAEIRRAHLWPPPRMRAS